MYGILVFISISKADLAAKFSLLPSNPMWLEIQHSFMSLCLQVVIILHNSFIMNALLDFFSFKSIRTDSESEKIQNFFFFFFALCDDVDSYYISLRSENKASLWEALFFCNILSHCYTSCLFFTL